MQRTMLKPKTSVELVEKTTQSVVFSTSSREIQTVDREVATLLGAPTVA